MSGTRAQEHYASLLFPCPSPAHPGASLPGDGSVSLAGLGALCGQRPELYQVTHPSITHRGDGFSEEFVELLLKRAPLRQMGLGERDGIQYSGLVGVQPRPIWPKVQHFLSGCAPQMPGPVLSPVADGGDLAAAQLLTPRLCAWLGGQRRFKGKCEAHQPSGS